MKHYVKVTCDGRTVTDAFIHADSPSDALKLALAGQGIDLSKVKPDRCYSVTCGDVMTSSYGDEFERTGYSASMKDVPNAQGHLHAPAPVVKKLTKETVDAIRNLGKGIVQEATRKVLRDMMDKAIAALPVQTGGPIGHAAEDIAKGEVGKVYLSPYTDPHGQHMTKEAIDKVLDEMIRAGANVQPAPKGSLREAVEKANKSLGLTPTGRMRRPPNIPPCPRKKDMTRVRMYPHRDKDRELAEAFGMGPKMMNDLSDVVDVESWEIEQSYESHSKTVRFTVHCPRCTTLVGMELVVVGTVSPIVRCRCNACGHTISARMPPYV